MGIVCGFYIVKDEVIEELLNNPEDSQDWIDENYSSVFGKCHFQNDTVFEVDKGWAVAKFLLKENDFTNQKILNSLDGEELNPKNYDFPKYIKSVKVKEINEILKTISEENIKEVFDVKKMQLNNVYNAEYFDQTNWQFLMLHINTIKEAFQKSAEKVSGIIINKH